MLRVGVAGGGCSGFQYALGFDDKFDAKEDAKKDCFGVTIVVDKKSDLYLDGTTIDFFEDISRRGFTFDNPNAAENLRLRQFVPRLDRVTRRFEFALLGAMPTALRGHVFCAVRLCTVALTILRRRP